MAGEVATLRHRYVNCVRDADTEMVIGLTAVLPGFGAGATSAFFLWRPVSSEATPVLVPLLGASHHLGRELWRSFRSRRDQRPEEGLSCCSRGWV